MNQLGRGRVAIVGQGLAGLVPEHGFGRALLAQGAQVAAQPCLQLARAGAGLGASGYSAR